MGGTGGGFGASIQAGGRLAMVPRLLGVFLIAGGVLFAQAPASSVEDLARARQTAMGREYARQLRGETVALESEAVRNYVDRVGRMLAAQMPGPPPSMEFTVAEITACPATPEPAALPGGFVVFPARLLAAARDESEFAAVVAHAVAHEVLHRTPVTAPEGGPSIPLVMLGGWTSDCRGRQSVPIGFAAALKKQEQEADAVDRAEHGDGGTREEGGTGETGRPAHPLVVEPHPEAAVG